MSWLQTIAAMHASGRQAVPQELPSQIDVITRSGQRFAERAEYPKGHARNPMTDGDVEAKHRESAPCWTGLRSGGNPEALPRSARRVIEKLGDRVRITARRDPSRQGFRKYREK